MSSLRVLVAVVAGADRVVALCCWCCFLLSFLLLLFILNARETVFRLLFFASLAVECCPFFESCECLFIVVGRRWALY